MNSRFRRGAAPVIAMAVVTTLTPVAAAASGGPVHHSMAFGRVALGKDATARVYTEDEDRILASAFFDSDGDNFRLTKRDSYGNRAYMEYKYIRKDGTAQEGSHWGLSTVDKTVVFNHNFGEGRKVAFRVCVQVDLGFDPCSGDDDGANWAVGYA
jgi:hypothetical protein